MAKSRLPDIFYSLAAPVALAFEDPVGTARPLTRDYSRYQGQVDAAVAVANGVQLMAHRNGISWGYHDAWFQANYAAFEGFDCYRTSYHVPYPDQPIVKQLDQVVYAEHPEIEIIPRIIDLELHRDQHPEKIAQFTWDMSSMIYVRDGVRPIIYSRYALINAWLVPYWTEAMLNEHYYFLAQYLFDRMREHPGPPTLPINVKRENVIIHQTADKKPGFPGEVQSKSVDYGRWEIGNHEEMHQWISQTWGGVIPPEPPVPEQDLFLMQVVTGDGLRVRTQPNTNGTIVAVLPVGKVVELEQDIFGYEGWGKIKSGDHAGNYIAVAYHGNRLAEPYQD